MKTIKIVLGVSTLALTFFFTSCLKENLTPNGADAVATGNPTKASVSPIFVSNWKSGNARYEVDQACGHLSTPTKTIDPSSIMWAHKIAIWNASTTVTTHSLDGADGPAANEITIEAGSTDSTFSWSSPLKVYVVVVKAGLAANIYYYENGACSDEDLMSPLVQIKGKMKRQNISHVTFGWNDVSCASTPVEVCYAKETAWAVGTKYTQQGGWATYTPYPGHGQSVNIMAGQHYPAGVATFIDNGDGTVNITITLNSTTKFYYNLISQTASDNLYIQHYVGTPSASNPSPGQFAFKTYANVGSSTYTATVPMAVNYGIHVNVSRVIPCAP